MANGQIVKRGNSWRARFEIGKDPRTGNRIHRNKSFKFKKDAEAFLAKQVTKVNEHTYMQVNNKVTVADYFNHYLDTVVALTCSGTTYDSYRSITNTHVLPNWGELPLALLSQDHLNRQYVKMLKDGLTQNTVLRAHRFVHTALEYAVNKADILAVNVAKKASAPKVPKLEARFLTIDEVDRVLEASRNSFYHCIFLLTIYTGMRRSEVLGLRIKDVNFDNGTVSQIQTVKRRNDGTVFIDPGKTNKFRAIPVSQSALLAVRSRIETLEADADALGIKLKPETLLFGDISTGQPLVPGRVSWAWRTLREKVGLEDVKYHDLRHTHASLLIAAGVHPKVISERLGHSNIQITMDTYGHLMPNAGREAADQFEDLMARKPVHS